MTNEISWSDETYRIFGVDPQEFVPTYNSFLSYVHPEDRDFVNDVIKKAFDGKPLTIDYRIMLPNGKEREVHIESEVISNKKRIPIQIKGTLQDITDRKQMEKELESIARLPEENPNPVMRLDKGYIIRYANPASHNLLTCWGSAIDKKAPSEIIDMAIVTMVDGINNSFECTYGNHIYIITFSPFPKFGYVNLYARDVTEQKEAENELQKSEEKYRNIVETANEGILVIDDGFLVTYANKKLTDMLGYSLGEGIGRPIWDFITEESKNILKLNLEKMLQDITNSFELKLTRKDGSFIWTHINTKVLFNENGKLMGSLSMLTDITESKKAEKMLKLKFEELARSNEELEQFAYVSSHDLQEPLRMITSYLQLLQRRYQGNLDDKADKYIHFAVDGASRMQNLINDLLEYSRCE